MIMKNIMLDMLIEDIKCILDEIDEKPDRKTDRDGGFGSTGKE